MERQVLYSAVCHVPSQIDFLEMKEFCEDANITYDRIIARVFKFYGIRTADLENLIIVLELTEIH